MQLLWPHATSPLVLASDDVHVWAVPVDRPAPAREPSTILSPDERQRADQFRFDEPRQRFTAGRIALRILLGKYLAIPAAAVVITCESNGKPRLGRIKDSIPLRFNLAHAGKLIIVAVACGCEVGVDVERVRSLSHWKQIAQRYFHDGEVEEILAAAPAARPTAFLRCWTSKEAIVKAMGVGLSHSLNSFRVSANDHDGMWVDVPDQTSRTSTRCWLRQLMPCDDYLAAVACVGEKRSISCLTFHWGGWSP